MGFLYGLIGISMVSIVIFVLLSGSFFILGLTKVPFGDFVFV